MTISKLSTSHLLAGRVLVTGGTGFVGQAVVRALAATDLSVKTTGRRLDAAKNQIKYSPADIRQPQAVLQLCRGVDYVVHAAGLAHQFGKVGNTGHAFQEINVEGTANVARAAVYAGVQHFILISSVSVYGSPNQPADEETPCHPAGSYAESKYRAEQVATEIAEAAGMPLTILRLATVYGEGDPGNVARLMRAIDRNRFVWIGNGNNLKSLIHCSDVGRACLAVLSQPSSGTNIYNLSDRPYTMKEIVQTLVSALGKSLPRVAIPAAPLRAGTRIAATLSRNPRLSDLHTTLQKWVADDVYDGSKFRQDFNYEPQVSLAEGIRREVEWYRREQSRR